MNGGRPANAFASASSTRSVRAVFFGTGEVSEPFLERLGELKVELAAVVTKPPKRRSRRGAAEPSAIERLAVSMAVPVHYSLDDLPDFDAGLVVAYGKILPAKLVESKPLLNVHFSLLPHLRGAAPIERAILAGETESGVTLIRIVSEMDAGPVLAARPVSIAGMSLSEARRALITAGLDLIQMEGVFTSAFFSEGVEQFGEPTFAAKIGPEDLRIRPAESAEIALRRIRLERAYLYFGARRVIVTDAVVAAEGPPGALGTLVPLTTGGVGVKMAKGVLVPRRVRPEGTGEMDFAAFVRGLRPPGDIASAVPS